MCNITSVLTFCTCTPNVIHNKHSRRHKKAIAQEGYTWTLNRYVGQITFCMEGLLNAPSTHLEAELTNELILTHLNTFSCFDFAYEPQEGDNLVVRSNQPQRYDFLSFIFRTGKWTVDHYNPFHDQTDRILSGILKIEKPAI